MTSRATIFPIATLLLTWAAQGAPRVSNLPLAFEPEPDAAGFTARVGAWGLRIGARETVFAAGQDGVSKVRVRMRLSGANPRARLTGLDLQAGRSNYLFGTDASRWRTNVRRYERVASDNVYPGISLVYYGKAGRLEHDFVIAPGGDPARIRLAIEGARSLRLDGAGNLTIQTAAGEITESKPEIYQWGDRGDKLPVEGGFRLAGNQVSFAIGRYDPAKSLVLDPVLTYGAYVGGAGDDIGYGTALDPAGNVYITGSTTSPDFLFLNPLQSKRAGGIDAFVAKFSPSGTLIYSTYFGGKLDDYGQGIAADGSGNVYVVGFTTSQDFPTTGAAYQRGFGGKADGFVVKLNPAGSALVYSTYLGGQLEDQAEGVAVDAAGNAYVTGTTLSSGFPVSKDAPQKLFGGVSDAFLTKLDATGTYLLYSTFLGGSDAEVGNAIALDSAGSAYVTGSSASKNFPALQAVQTGLAGGTDAFFAQINAAGTAWVRTSLLGGTGNDSGNGIAADTNRVWIVGQVSGIKPDVVLGVQPPTPIPTFPTTANAYQSAYGGGDSDAFVAGIVNGVVAYSSFLGREGAEVGQSARLDAGSFWAAIQNTGTTTPAPGSRVAGNNPASLCGGETDSTGLFQFDAQFRPANWSCVNFVATSLALDSGRLALAGAATAQFTFTTLPPAPPPQLGTNPASPVRYNGGATDAVFQLYSTATPAANLEGFFPVTLGGAPGPALAADFDGLGGANDVLVSGANMTTLTSLFNISGTGPAAAAGTTITTPLAATPLVPTSGTIFKDPINGRNDIALAGLASASGLSGAGQILVGVNNGGGSFAGFQQLVASPGVSGLYHGDFNNDGFDDLGYLDFNNDTAAVTLNDGKNNFALPTFQGSGGLVAISQAVGDFDDDGNLDVAMLSQGLRVLPNFQFVQSGISLLRGQGDGTLQGSRGLQDVNDASSMAVVLSMIGGMTDVEVNGARRVVDFNNDGFADLVVASAPTADTPGLRSPILTVMLNQPDNPGTFSTSPAQGVIGQFPAQAPPLPTSAAPQRALSGIGASTVLEATASVTQGMPMAAADFDRDGNWDLAVLNPFTNTLSILKGDGRGGLTPAGTYLVGRMPISVAVADINGDKMPDLVVTNSDSRSVQLFLNRNPPPAVETPEISAAGVANAASFRGGAVSPGEIVTLFGSGMGPTTLAGLQLDASGKVATQVAGTRVLFDGIAAPIVYTSAGQISAIVPYSVAGKAHTVIQVEYQGRGSNRVARPVALFKPAMFTSNSSGKGQAAILNQNGSVNGASNPADKGSIVVLYATGEGQTNPPGVDGLVAGAVAPKPQFPVRVKIGGVDADVVYYGAAPGLVSGVLQVNAVVPAGTPSGSAVPVTISVAAVNSPAGTTVAIK